MVPEGWATTSIGSAVQVGRGFAFKSEQYRDAGHPILRVSNISEDGAISNQDDWKYIDPSEVSDFARYALNDLDILIVMVGATTGKLGFVSNKDLPALLNQNMWSLRAKESKGLSQRYFRYIARGVVDRFLSTMQGSARGFLRQSDFSKQTFTIPPLAEQRKIADILSTWDAAIEKTEALLATAKAQKRALMQSLLTGKRRFPEFEGQQWKEVRLGDVVSGIRGGGTPDKSEPAFWSGSVPWVSVKDLKARTIQTTIDSISEEGLQNSASNAFPAETVVVATRMAVGVTVKLGARMAINQDLKAVLPSKSIRNDFLFYNLMMSEGKLSALGTGSTVKGITLADLRRLPIWLPASVAEQDRIVSVLEDADTEISCLVADLTKLRTEKKALMQQLLTGKRRVVV